jgi:ABC-type transport system involved in cytochrome bd biosynthesis fused ATPase/permease subunit
MYRCLESRHKARIEGISELLGLGEFIRSLPNGLSTKLEEGGNNLSGDQRQRLAGQSCGRLLGGAAFEANLPDR